VISEENFKNIVFPLDISNLLYVGKRSADTLNKFGIHTIGQLAEFNKEILIKHLGKTGALLSDYANGLDSSPVKKWGEQDDLKSVGNGMTFQRNLTSENDIKTAVTALADIVSQRMRKHNVKCTTVSVQIKSPDFKSVQKQKALDFSTDVSSEIREVAMELISHFWNFKSPIRSITITGTNLVSGKSERQISFFGDTTDYKRLSSIDQTMDKIRKKYGSSSINFASIVQNDLGIETGNQKEE
jgi:DNA polymerase-4